MSNEREIKLKAWDKKNNKIVEIDTIEFIDRIEGRPGCNVFISDKNPKKNYWLESMEVEMLRNTGIKDQTQTEIYEHHICKTPSGRLGEVCYDEGRAGFIFRDGLNEMLYKVYPLEIVGNRYQNPELLKQIETQ